MKILLLVSAGPSDQDRLRLGHEVKTIRQALQRSRWRENWTIETVEAATVDDLRRALLDFRPTVLHFSGHGGGPVGLAFESDSGSTHLAQAASLTKLLHHFKDSLKCVVLNACYSEVQANEIRAQIDYVIGMAREIGDETAVKFAVGFYDAIFAGTTFRQAFDIACAAIDLSNLPDHSVPVFLSSVGGAPTSLAYTQLIPQIEDMLLLYINTPFNERFKFTTKGDQLLKAMTQFYGESLHSRIEKVSVLSTRNIDEATLVVSACLESRGGRAMRKYFVRVTEQDVKIEWEASVGYWSLPPKTYRALGTDTHVIARVTAQLGTYYHGEFSDKADVYQSFNLTSLAGDHLIGYVRRHSTVGKELLTLLSDGNKHDVSLAIANVNDDTEHAVIYELVSKTWLVPEGAQDTGEQSSSHG